MLSLLLLSLTLAAPAAAPVAPPPAPGSIPAPSLHVGDEALLFALPALNEQAALKSVAKGTVALSDYTGVNPAFPAKVLVVQFMDRNGGEFQLQALNRLSKKYARQGVRVVVILADNGDLPTLSGWVESQAVDFPVLNDTYRVVVERYGVKVLPMTFVIDAEGTVQAIGVPRSDLETSLDALLQPYVTTP